MSFDQKPKLLLFDIDGTLILSGGAGLRGMNRAFEQLYGTTNILDGISLAGRTDNKIMMDAYKKAGIPFSVDELDRFKKAYFEFIREEVNADGTNKRTMPGITELLPQLAARGNVHLALLTGNWEKSGRAKLGCFDMNKYFPFGAFSDDSSEREELAPVAMQRFEQRIGERVNPEQVYIIGDTPGDIHCAKPHGVISVAVAAAAHSAADLRPHDPDYLFEDLTATKEILEILG